MKKVYIILFSVFFTLIGNAQTRGISYQALIINPHDEEVPGFNGKQTPLANKEVCLRFSFIDSSYKVEYQEIQKIKTDEFGMVNLLIGLGKYSAGYIDSFKNINWDGSTKRLKVEVDVKYDCQIFEEISNQILAYVPFAFYALNSPASKIPGPKGDTGVGIKEIKNNSDTLIIKLSNDSIVKLGNIKGIKGDVGDQGPKGDTGSQGKQGIDGIGILNVQVKNDSLFLTMTDSTIKNAGYVKGNTGAQGPQGPTGATGSQGPAGTNGISVTNSQVVNDSLKVTLSNGTIINAGYVKGNTGSQGPQGIQGLTGPQGLTGATGATGPAGTNGISVTNSQVINDSLKVTLSNGTIINAGYVKGNTGSQGPQGIQGLTGATGPQGPAGTNGISVTNSQVVNDSLKVILSNGTIKNAGYVKGNTGSQGPQGPTGASGPQGPQGLTGATGSQGPAGTNGISVTNSQVVNDSLKVTLSNGTIINAGYVKGNTGAQGPQGIQGLTGATGSQGPAGTNGISVTNSQVVNDSLKVTLSNGTIINAGYVKGNTGAQGPQGIQGLTGATGPQGPTGASGPQGPQGLTGATGATGPAGTNGISVTNSQVVNDSLKVTLSNGTIINAGYVKGNTGAQGPQGPQGLTGATGSQGPAGINGISVTNSQVVNDSLKVTLSNGTIINAGYVKGNTGSQGPQGIQGLTGAQGPTGATGATGPAGTNGISVTNSQVVNDSLKVTLSNGTIINAGYVKGNTGAQGPLGPQGLTGATGSQGPAGTNGISVTNSQVVNDSLKVTLSNGSIINAGYVKGIKGDTGFLAAGTNIGNTPFWNGSNWIVNNNNIYNNGGSVGIGNNNPNISSKLDIQSTTQGVLLPRMTQAQKNNISNPALGLLIFQTDIDVGFYFYNGTTWIKLANMLGGSGSDANTLIYTTKGF